MKLPIFLSIALILTSNILHSAFNFIPLNSIIEKRELQKLLFTFEQNQNLYRTYKNGEIQAITGAVVGIFSIMPLFVQKYENPKQAIFGPVMIYGLSSVLLFHFAHLNRQGQKRVIQDCKANLTDENLKKIEKELKYNREAQEFLQKIKT